MNQSNLEIKKIQSYPDTDRLLDDAGLSGDVLDIIIVGVALAQHKGQEDVIDVYAQMGETTEIISEMGDPYGTRVELDPDGRHEENRKRLIENLFQDKLIEEDDIKEFEGLDDQRLRAKAMKLYRKVDYAGTYNDSVTLLEDIRADFQARRKGYAHLVLGEAGNIYFDTELDTLKFFIATNYTDHGVMLVDDGQVEKFIKEKGKGLLRKFKNKELRNKIVAAVEKFVVENEADFPVAAKLVNEKFRDAGREN